MAALRLALRGGRNGLHLASSRLTALAGNPAAATATVAATRLLPDTAATSWLAASPALALPLSRGFSAPMPAQEQNVAERTETVKAGDSRGNIAAPGEEKSAEASASKEEQETAEMPATRGTRGKGSYWLFQPIYTKEYTEKIAPKHLPPETFRERLALGGVTLMRTIFDRVTRYGHNMDEAQWLRRILYLETIAGVPGMVAGMLRHLHSLRRMERDHGWIHTMLEEAENERMHLLTFMTLRQPGWFFRTMVLIGQGTFFNAYFITYLLSPKYCHSFVGYLEEEAVKTYTRAIEDLDAGKLPEWSKTPAPDVAKRYWGLSDDAGMRELLMAVRADEAGHSHVNHVLAKLPPNADNPFEKGSHAVP